MTHKIERVFGAMMAALEASTKAEHDRGEQLSSRELMVVFAAISANIIKRFPEVLQEPHFEELVRTTAQGIGLGVVVASLDTVPAGVTRQ